MTYLSTKKMLIDAKHGGYVVGAFNIVDYTSMAAVVEAATEKSSPVIIQTSQKTVTEMGYEIFPEMIEKLSGNTFIPVAMMLDQGTDVKVVKKCIDYGWPSIMIDGSLKPFKENIRLTKEIVEYAHKKGVTVEGKLCCIGRKEENINVNQEKMLLASPEKAVEFQRLTGVDSLAVTVGTGNRLYNGKHKLDFSCIFKIMKLCYFPIVIHECPDFYPDDLKKIISYGPSKMNVSAEIKHVYLDSFGYYIDKSHKNYIKKKVFEYEPIEAIKMVKNQIKNLVKDYIDIFGSSGKAYIEKVR